MDTCKPTYTTKNSAYILIYTNTKKLKSNKKKSYTLGGDSLLETTMPYYLIQENLQPHSDLWGARANKKKTQAKILGLT